jgi:hypothetical protein
VCGALYVNDTLKLGEAVAAIGVVGVVAAILALMKS